MSECKKQGKYNLPQNVYLRTLYLIRDYERLKAIREDIIYGSPPPADGQPRGSGSKADETASKAIRLEMISKECEAIEQAMICIPEEYRRGVVDNVMYQVRYPDTAHYRTWVKYKGKFIKNVAENIGYV